MRSANTFSESDGNHGGNAGDGGNIIVVKDSSLKHDNLNYKNSGGSGGSRAYGFQSGKDGDSGQCKEEVRTVSF